MDSRNLSATGGFCTAPFRRISVHPHTRIVRRDWPVAVFRDDYPFAGTPGARIDGDAFPLPSGDRD